jgi:murein DD-endopeptidase MepM/ murein hydrolase activator NlpD
MTKLGAHVTTGQRTGYGDFVAARPAVITAVDEGGALLEAKEKSGGHTVTIFRDTTVYLESPGDINSPPAPFDVVAAFWYEQLKPKWMQNPADYYTITNEQGGNDPPSLRNLVAYEREVMKLANADGFKVCVLNLAGGSPGDFELWKEICAPLILEAWAAGNIYGRHAYGGDLVDAAGHIRPGNPRRPVEEIVYLNSLGARGGLVIKEAGLDGGFGFAGTERFFTQMSAYERALRPFQDIIGICMWNLGKWQSSDANWMDAIPAFVDYMARNPTASWRPPEPGVVIVSPGDGQAGPGEPGDEPVVTGPGDSPGPDEIPGPGEAPGPPPTGQPLTELAFTGFGERDVAAQPSLAPAAWYDVGNVQVPIVGGQRWVYWEAEGGNEFGDGQPWNDFASPEGVHRWDAHLPPHEHFYLNARGRCYHLFAPAGAWWARFSFSQHLEPGLYRLSLDVWGDWVDIVDGQKVPKPDPGHARVELFLGQQGRQEWQRPPYADRAVLTREFVVEQPGAYQAGFGVLTVFAPGGGPAANGCFLRGFTLERVVTAAPPGAGEGAEAGAEAVAASASGPQALWEHLWQEGIRHQVVSLNRTAALQMRLYGDGFVPTSSEFTTGFSGAEYVCQLAEHLGSGEKRLYYARVPDWSEVRFITQSQEAPVAPGAPPAGPEPEGPSVTVDGPVEFRFQHWPTVKKGLNQGFGERPEKYKKFGLPGHEGVDLPAPFGTPYMAVAPGRVIWASDRKRSEPDKASAYGWHVILDHGGGYSTLYGHAQEELPVIEGQMVTAGQVVGFSGNSGNSEGPHLHLTLQKEGHVTEGWPPRYMDPWPFLEPLFSDLQAPISDLVEGYLWATSLELHPGNLAQTRLNLNLRQHPSGEAHIIGVVPTGSVVRVLRQEKEEGYLYCEASVPEASAPGAGVPGAVSPGEEPAGDALDLLPYLGGDGRLYEVANALGSQERFQTQWEGSHFYQTKNRNWEGFFFDSDFIYRDLDTSPGGGRYYRLTDPDRQVGSRWMRRRMKVGESFAQQRRVQFFVLDNCAPSEANSGTVTDTMLLAGHHPTITLRTGLEVEDVIELHWVNGGEKYFYGRGFGLVAWERMHQDPHTPQWSALSEVHAPSTRPDNERLRIQCL